MGNYTPNEEFYLIDPDQLVNVEQDINYNWSRADERVRFLSDYYMTDAESISASQIPKQLGYKYYKTYSNSIWVCRDTDKQSIFQDTNSPAPVWKDDLLYEAGYSSSDQESGKIRYSVFAGFVYLSGRLVFNNQNSDIPSNTTVKWATFPPVARPSEARYINVYGGNSNSDFQYARFYIPAASSSDWRSEFIKYGGPANVTTERYLSLNNIRYPLD